MKECTAEVRIVNVPEFKTEYYKAFCNTALHPDLDTTKKFNTIDLVALLQRLASENYQETNFSGFYPERTILCLGILAQEGLIDLSVSVDFRGHTIFNLTKTEDPYWVIPHRFCGYENYADARLATVALRENTAVWDFYALPIENAIDILLKKSNHNWFHQWELKAPEPINWSWGRLPNIPSEFVEVDPKKIVHYKMWSMES